MMPVRRVVPAVLSNDPLTLRALIAQAQGFSRWLQLDIMDGFFVPASSVGLEDMLKVHPRVDWEAHLMVCRPEEYFIALAQEGARRIIFHLEAVQEPLETAVRLRALGIEVGLAVNPDTPVSAIDENLAAVVDYVLFMSVYPGFYGKPFIPQALEKVKVFKLHHPDVAVGVDGGIKMDNIALAAQAGADEICVGSAIFAARNPAESYRRLTEAAGAAWDRLDSNG